MMFNEPWRKFGPRAVTVTRDGSPGAEERGEAIMLFVLRWAVRYFTFVHDVLKIKTLP